MILVSLDLETTGLETDTCEVLELGYAMYDTEISQDTPILMRSHLCVPKGEITQEITDITGITQKMIDAYAVPFDEAFCEFIGILNKYKPCGLVGHNLIDYDLPIAKRYVDMMSEHMKVENKLTYIDTRIDLPHKRPPKNNSLVFLSADIAKFCNPFSHRALFDCLATMKVLFSFNVEEIFKKASSPLVTVRADVSFGNKDLAKKAGYNWDGDQKIWTKTIRLSNLNDEKSKSTFPVLMLGTKNISEL